MSRVLGVLVLAAACSTPSSRPARDGAATAFLDVTIVPMDSERTLEHQTVIVRGGRITAMGPAIDIPADARIVDGNGRFLLPGLSDMHSHLTRETDLARYVAHGVTTVRNMWGAPVHLEWRERIAQGSLVGPRILTAGPIVDGESPVHDGSLVLADAAGADAVVKLHQEKGYDFVKVYSRLSGPAYRALVEKAHAAGLKVAGHIPREVGLAGALDEKQDSLEHLHGFLDALQSDASPVKGLWDRASNARKIDFVDETKLPALAQRIAAQGTWVVPTLTVITDFAPAETRALLARDAMRLVPPLFTSMWQPGKEPSPDDLAAYARGNALNTRIIQALRAAGARILVGTDPANPHVIPGLSVHDELVHLVQAGLTPFEALRAATVDGRIARGERADLVLVDGNPLTDIRSTRNVRGVMVQSRWLDEKALQALLEQAADHVRPELPPLEGHAQYHALFEVTWNGARFGVEEILVDEQGLRAQALDEQYSQRSVLEIHGDRARLASDGTKGRGHVELSGNRLAGVLLSGLPAERTGELAEGTVLGGKQMLAGYALVGKRLLALKPGEKIEVPMKNLALGSSMALEDASFSAERLPDGTFSIASKGPKATLTLDENGWPAAYEIHAWGAPVQFKRVR